jgi:hypothetical protein
LAPVAKLDTEDAKAEEKEIRVKNKKAVKELK